MPQTIPLPRNPRQRKSRGRAPLLSALARRKALHAEVMQGDQSMRVESQPEVKKFIAWNARFRSQAAIFGASG